MVVRWVVVGWIKVRWVGIGGMGGDGVGWDGSQCGGIISLTGYWSYFQIAGNQPTRLFQTRYARFWMLTNVKNQFKILNVYKL